MGTDHAPGAVTYPSERETVGGRPLLEQHGHEVHGFAGPVDAAIGVEETIDGGGRVQRRLSGLRRAARNRAPRDILLREVDRRPPAGGDGVRPSSRSRADRNPRVVPRPVGPAGRAPASTLGPRHAADFQADRPSRRISESAGRGRGGPRGRKLWSQRRTAGHGQAALRSRQRLQFRNPAAAGSESCRRGATRKPSQAGKKCCAELARVDQFFLTATDGACQAESTGKTTSLAE